MTELIEPTMRLLRLSNDGGNALLLAETLHSTIDKQITVGVSMDRREVEWMIATLENMLPGLH